MPTKRRESIARRHAVTSQKNGVIKVVSTELVKRYLAFKNVMFITVSTQKPFNGQHFEPRDYISQSFLVLHFIHFYNGFPSDFKFSKQTFYFKIFYYNVLCLSIFRMRATHFVPSHTPWFWKPWRLYIMINKWLSASPIPSCPLDQYFLLRVTG
jgi:hypothetical protein